MSDPTRRILDRIGETTYLPVVNIEEADAVPVLGFPILGLVLGSRIHTLATVPGVLFGIVLGVALVRAAPPHLRAVTWLGDVARHYLRRPRVTTSAPNGTPDPRRRGGLAGHVPFVPDEDTRGLVGLRRAWGGVGAIERDDGVFEGWIEVSPGNMDLAVADDWATLQGSARQFANDDLDFDLTVFVTTRSFPTAELIGTLEDRLEDPDVRSNTVFQDLVTEYREQRPERLADVRDVRYFVGVEVVPESDHGRTPTGATPLERLATVPVLGPWLFSRFVARRSGHSEGERRERAVRTLDERLGVVETEFVRRMPGWSARRLSTLEVFLLATDFWNGTEYAQDAAENAHLLNELPAATSLSRDGAGGDRR